MKLVNLTPHVLDIHTAYGRVEHVAPSGSVARCSVTNTHVATTEEGIALVRGVMGDVTGLPEPAAGTIYIVSALVRGAVPGRADVASPGDLVRDAEGKPVGCRGLVIN